MKRNDFLNILQRSGVNFYRHGSNHDIYIHEKSGKKIPVPRHGEIKNQVVINILKEIPQS
jgi:predicted RNA binding protein YcfA (HicA-like mRNA interferase family)